MPRVRVGAVPRGCRAVVPHEDVPLLVGSRVHPRRLYVSRGEARDAGGSVGVVLRVWPVRINEPPFDQPAEIETVSEWVRLGDVGVIGEEVMAGHGPSRLEAVAWHAWSLVVAWNEHGNARDHHVMLEGDA